MKILLAEDDCQLSAQLTRLLRTENFVVDHADNGIDAEHLGLSGDYDCVILDLGLPGLKGETVLQHWRAARREFPILVLTARDAWLDKAAAFGAGADDYITKPFRPGELREAASAQLNKRVMQANLQTLAVDKAVQAALEEQRHQLAHAKLAQGCQVPHGLVPTNGDVVRLEQRGGRQTTSTESERRRGEQGGGEDEGNR